MKKGIKATKKYKLHEMLQLAGVDMEQWVKGALYTELQVSYSQLNRMWNHQYGKPGDIDGHQLQIIAAFFGVRIERMYGNTPALKIEEKIKISTQLRLKYAKAVEAENLA